MQRLSGLQPNYRSLNPWGSPSIDPFPTLSQKSQFFKVAAQMNYFSFQYALALDIRTEKSEKNENNTKTKKLKTKIKTKKVHVQR